MVASTPPPERTNFLNYALRVFLVTLLLPGAAVVFTAAAACWYATADGSLLRGFAAATGGGLIWGVVGTVSSAYFAFSKGASRIVDRAAIGNRLRSVLLESTEEPAEGSGAIPLSRFRSLLQSHSGEIITRPGDARPASLVGIWLLKRMQQLAVWAITRFVRSGFTRRENGEVVVNVRELAVALTGEFESRVVAYVRRQAILAAGGLCVGGCLLTVILVWAVRQLPL